jgi:hypothetical protein
LWANSRSGGRKKELERYKDRDKGRKIVIYKVKRKEKKEYR